MSPSRAVLDELAERNAGAEGEADTIRRNDLLRSAVACLGWAAVGLDRYIETEIRGASALSSGTVIAGNKLSSISLYEAAGDIVEAGDVMAGGVFTDLDGNTVLSGLTAATTFQFTVKIGKSCLRFVMKH